MPSFCSSTNTSTSVCRSPSGVRTRALVYHPPVDAAVRSQGERNWHAASRWNGCAFRSAVRADRLPHEGRDRVIARWHLHIELAFCIRCHRQAISLTGEGDSHAGCGHCLCEVWMLHACAVRIIGPDSNISISTQRGAMRRTMFIFRRRDKSPTGLSRTLEFSRERGAEPIHSGCQHGSATFGHQRAVAPAGFRP